MLEHLDGKLWPEDLSEEGQAFARAQYEKYLGDFEDLIVALNLDNAYYVEDSEENYQNMAAALDKRWERYTAATSAKR